MVQSRKVPEPAGTLKYKSTRSFRSPSEQSDSDLTTLGHRRGAVGLAQVPRWTRNVAASLGHQRSQRRRWAAGTRVQRLGRQKEWLREPRGSCAPVCEAGASQGTPAGALGSSHSRERENTFLLVGEF